MKINHELMRASAHSSINFLGPNASIQTEWTKLLYFLKMRRRSASKLGLPSLRYCASKHYSFIVCPLNKHYRAIARQHSPTEHFQRARNVRALSAWKELPQVVDHCQWRLTNSITNPVLLHEKASVMRGPWMADSDAVTALWAVTDNLSGRNRGRAA